MADCYITSGTLIAWCILVWSCVLFMGTPTVLGKDIDNPGSTKKSVKFGDSSQSNVAQTLNADGSGDCYIIYGDCSASTITTKINVIGSGDTYIMYGSSCSAEECQPLKSQKTEEWAKNMNNPGSGDLYVRFGDCKSSSSSKLDLDVYNRGSGTIRIYYTKYNPSKVSNTTTTSGSGKVYAKYAN